MEVLKAQRAASRLVDNIDDELADEMAECYLDPYRFVMLAFDWGVGELEKFDGPDKWQTAFLKDIRDKLQNLRSDEETVNDALFYATKAGHGVGKSASTSWIILWLMSTRPHFSGLSQPTLVTSSPARLGVKLKSGGGAASQATGSSTTPRVFTMWSTRTRGERTPSRGRSTTPKLSLVCTTPDEVRP
jgi:hypothetical protein